MLRLNDSLWYVLTRSGSSGTPHVPTPHTTDILTFLIVIVTASRSVSNRYHGMPTVVDNTRRDISCSYSWFKAQLFISFAPVGDTRYARRPLTGSHSSCMGVRGESNSCGGCKFSLLDLVITSHIMLSLKQASIQPKAPWCLEMLTTVSYGRSTEDGTVHFSPRVLSGLLETPRNSVALNKEDVRLDAVT